MKNRISVTIAGQKYTVLAEESAEYTNQVAARADARIAEARTVTESSALGAAVLAALNLADEATKAENDAMYAREELVERAEQNEAMRAEITRLQAENDTLKSELNRLRTNGHKRKDMK